MKRLRYLALAVVILLLGWLVFRSIGPKEPSYQGRRLTQWLNDYKESLASTRPEKERRAKEEQTGHAVKQIGTNAIPTLLVLIQATNSPLKLKLNSLLDRQHFIRFRFQTAWTKRFQGEYGFVVLKKDALPAVPDLLQLLQSRDVEMRRVALQCLCNIDHEPGPLLPVYLKAWHDSDREMRVTAAYQLHFVYPLEAKKAGVYEMMPGLEGLKPYATATNSPASQ